MNDRYNQRSGRREDEPQVLPVFPDTEGGTPAFPGGSTEPTPPTPSLPVLPEPNPPTPSVPSVPSRPTVPSVPSRPPMRCARVRFFHAAPQAGAVNVNVGMQRAATNLSFGNFSTYYCYGEGFRNITVMNARTGRTVLLRTTVPLNAGEMMTFVITSNASTSALELVGVNDNACQGQLGDFACVRMANFLLGSAGLDLLMSDGRLVFSDVRYKETTMSRRLRPGSYNFLVANTPPRIEPRIVDVELDDGSYRISDRYIPGYGELDPVTSFSLNARRGVMYTAYVIGQLNTDEVQVVVSGT